MNVSLKSNIRVDAIGFIVLMLFNFEVTTYLADAWLITLAAPKSYDWKV